MTERLYRGRPKSGKKRRERPWWPNRFTMKIGAHRWAVSLTKRKLFVKEDDTGEKREVGGWCSPTKKEITVNVDREVDYGVDFRLCEEVAHAINDHLDIDDDPKPVHHLLRQWVGAFLVFLRDNPKFFKTLLAHSGPTEKNKRRGWRRGLRTTRDE